VPAATRRALNARDGGCRWPGCTRPPSWTAAHHVVHWSHHGPTDQDNLVLLCRHHHWCVHEGGWTLVHTDDEGILALSPVVGVQTPLRDPRPVLPTAAPAQAHRAREPALPPA
jgi:HNH endonuclease